jgi:hypothetical protein
VRIRGLILAVALAAAALGFVLHPAPTAGPALRDFESYYAAGATWRYHGDPYSREVWRTERTIPGVNPAREELLPFVGPPFALPLWDALARLPWGAAAALWAAVMALGIAAIAFGSLRLAGGRCDALDCAAVLVLAAGFGPLTSGVALGQAAVVSCAAIVVTPLLLGPRRTFAAAASALVAALQPNLAIVLAARATERRAGIAFALAGTVALGGSAIALADSGGLLHYLAVLRDHAGSERFIAIQVTLGAVARALGAPAALAGTLALGVALVSLILVVVQCRSRRYAPDARLALACAALPLAWPFAHEHDLTLAFLPAVFALRRATGRAWVIAALATLAIATDWLGLAQRPTGSIETLFLTLAAALGLTVLARGPLRLHHALPALACGAVAAAAAVARAHPLPTWPDALPAGFTVARTVPAPAVWHLEQLASGIGGLDPVWGLLRLASLGGCAVLWAAASVALAQPRVTEPATPPRSEPFSTPLRPPAATYPSRTETS